ncbi:motile sperm domain-containing protein 1-like [Anthonomus grandis grandis]|uniref:motile sperm domain-containing protein 1-like n=1 Tax=Anthonomus grandis grandis TaxID=2921223 RepID=UPI0021664F20|nr:motile sperm domain-containing protein 1-like [Anthonomus grandis grandis]
MSLSVRKLPLFAFPTSLRFYMGTKSSYTQVLTLYSPYDFPIKYKVHCLSSAWEKYHVHKPEGSIPGQSSIELIITHKQPTPMYCNELDKFKIVMHDPVTKQIIGKKTIESVLLPGIEEPDNNDEDFDFCSEEGSSNRSGYVAQTSRIVQQQEQPSKHTPNNFLFTFIICMCAIILFLPTEPEELKESKLPSYLHVTHKLQLLAALLLGVFLCVLVKP